MDYIKFNKVSNRTIYIPQIDIKNNIKYSMKTLQNYAVFSNYSNSFLKKIIFQEYYDLILKTATIKDIPKSFMDVNIYPEKTFHKLIESCKMFIESDDMYVIFSNTLYHYSYYLKHIFERYNIKVFIDNTIQQDFIIFGSYSNKINLYYYNDHIQNYEYNSNIKRASYLLDNPAPSKDQIVIFTNMNVIDPMLEDMANKSYDDFLGIRP